MSWFEAVDWLLAMRSRAQSERDWSGPPLEVIDDALRLAKWLEDDETPPPDEVFDIPQIKGIGFSWLCRHAVEYLRVGPGGKCVFVRIPKHKRQKVIRFRLTRSNKPQLDKDDLQIS